MDAETRAAIVRAVGHAAEAMGELSAAEGTDQCQQDLLGVCQDLLGMLGGQETPAPAPAEPQPVAKAQPHRRR